MKKASAVLILSLLASCGKAPGDEKKTGALPVAAPPPSGTRDQAPASPALFTPEKAPPSPVPGGDAFLPSGPLVSIAVNDMREGTIPRGWPLIVQVLLRAPPSGPVTLKSGQGAWQDLVSLEVEGQPWPLQRAPATAPSITLTDTYLGIAAWIVTPEESMRLSLGQTRLRATVKSPETPGDPSWHGAVTSSPAAFEIVEARSELPPAERATFAEESMQAALWMKDRERALAIAGKALEDDPKQWRILHLRGRVLGRMGKDEEATASYQQAVNAWAETHPNQTPPPFILQDQDLILSQRLRPR